MAKYAVYGKVVGSKYLGEFEAESEAAAIEQAEASDECFITFCHHCSPNCEDPEIDGFTVEKVKD